MTLSARSPRPLALALLAAAALLAAFYASAERAIYATGVPTGVAATATLGLVVAGAFSAGVLAWRDVSAKDAALFVALVVGGGLGGAVGSVLGNAAGEAGLYAGGLLGGLAAVAGVAALAARLRWIARTQVGGTAAGAALGFLVAAAVAVSTLSSPVGPVASTCLVGVGGLLGARYAATPRPSLRRPA